MSDTPEVEKTELQEVEDTQKPKITKDTSYTYWVSKDPNFFAHQKPEDIQPQKVEQAKLEQIKKEEEAKKDGHSAWNTAGTWEEKSLKANNFKDILEKNIIGYQTKNKKIEITGVNSVSGEGRLIVSRGKKRIGFDINITVAYKGLTDLDGTSGTISYKDFQEDGDHEHDVDVEGEGNTNECRKVVNSALPELAELLLNTLQKLKD